MKKEKTQDKIPSTKLHKALTIIGIVLCVILIPMLIINCTLIVKSIVNEDEVPSIGKATPLIVLTDSMYDEIKSGDIIITMKAEPDEVEVGDVISFFDPASRTNAITTHRVYEIYEEEGMLYFRTKGDNNNTEDKEPVPGENLVGIWEGVRIGGVGRVALFMQTTPGLILCVVLPLLLLIGYDILRRRIYEKKNGKDVDALMAELEALKAAKAAEETKAEPAEEPKTEE
jgi:signal peptidase